ncbi:MAG TPA: response regulator transcription factor [Caldilineaceae bacterium]|nr:response regulator transcription factor [Caldilineaceae bacterium]
MTKIRVILADDHPVVRTGICALLERDPEIVIVAEATNGAEVLPLVEEHKPDVLVLDIEMPQLTGVEVARQIKIKKLPVRVLALSAYVDEHYVQKVLQSGAAGYLMKEEAPAMIVDAVRGVARGEEGWMSRRAVAQMNSLVHREENDDALTPREQEVLQLVAAGKTNQEIARTLQISESTVEKHVGAIMTKLQVSSRVEAAVQAVRKGWA